MPWSTLDRFPDHSDSPPSRPVPKLGNLARAARLGFAVPPTVWASAPELEARPVPGLPTTFGPPPWIVRSGSPTEDTHATSNAGQLLSLVVEEAGGFAEAVGRVVAALPREAGRPLGVVFVQPIVRAARVGVTFFDGFYYEETSAAGSNAGLTQGTARGDVRRDHLRRGSDRDAWLARLGRAFGPAIDIEWALPIGAEPGGVPVLLQVRPALFPIRRNETLSLANHKEILGDPPSPWMTGTLVDAGKTVLGFFGAADPEVDTWHEVYAVELAERAWLNLSAIVRLMDHWGMPRTMVTDSFGGSVGDGPDDAKVLPRRLLGHVPILLRKGMLDLVALARIGRAHHRIEAAIGSARTLAELYRANVESLEIAIRTNMAINSLLSLVAKARKPLGLAANGRVVTHEMMAEYAKLAARPEAADRLRGLDDWLERFGHRGPLESDPARPRFLELRQTLRDDLERGPAPAPAALPKASLLRALGRFATGPLFAIDAIRERFRDGLMRSWQVLRGRILEEARAAVALGHLDRAEDVFSLRGDDLEADPRGWPARVLDRKARVEAASRLILPDTGSRDAIEAAIHRGEDEAVGPAARASRFRGIGLGNRVVVGTAVRRSALTDLLDGRPMPDSPILVAETLEPSWAVVFPRFAGVVVELGGELSHASILLREAGIPAVINAEGSFRAIVDGEPIRLDATSGTVERLSAQ